MRSSAEIISDQRGILDAVYQQHVSYGSTYALIDFPDHPNVGDSAIWLGEIEILRQMTGRLPAYVSTYDAFDAAALKQACPNGVVFIHGGGNLGDIWEQLQLFRESVLELLPKHKIVQLPQSIKYRDVSKASRFENTIRAHGNFHLYVRDEASLAFAKTHFSCSVALVPDSAFGIGPKKRATPRLCTYTLMRTDVEQVGYDQAAFKQVENAEIGDWLIDSARLVKIKRRRNAIIARAPRLDLQALRVRWYNWLAQERVNRGMAQLAQGERVVTDRLHGHILSTILDIPHATLDNDYGKTSGYIVSWTQDYEGVTPVNSIGQAVDWTSTGHLAAEEGNFPLMREQASRLDR